METHHKHVNDNNYLEVIIRGFSTENNIKKGKLWYDTWQGKKY